MIPSPPLRFSANLSTLFQDLPLVERFGAAARSGFDAIELWFPYELPADQMSDLLKAHGLICVGINSPAGNVANGDWGLAADPKRRSEFDDSVGQAMSYAKAIGCDCVHVMAGQIGAETQPDVAWHNYLSCIDSACEVARACGRTVMIEPLNALDRPRYLLNTQSQALEVIQVLGRDNLKIMLDIFHLQRGEGNLIERLRNSISHTAHVQIADNLGRHEPGTGEINFARVFSALSDFGYAGWVGCEFFASGAIDDSLRWLSDLGALLARSSESLAKKMA